MVLIYVSVFLGLTALALWDAVNIINEYSGGNRIISVLEEPITDRFPFLKTDAALRLSFESNWVPLVGIVDLKEYFRIAKSAWINETDPFHDEKSIKKVMADYYGTLVLPYYVVRILDERGPNETLELIPYFAKDFIPKFVRILDDYITNRESLNMTRSTWLHAMQAIIQGSNLGDTDITLHSVSPTWICFSIPVSDKLTRNNSLITYFMDFVDTSNSSSDNVRPPYLLHLTVSPNDQFIMVINHSDSSIYAKVSIVNNGVSDSSRISTTCTTNFDTEEECLTAIKEKVFEKTCNCTPLTKFLRHASLETANVNRFCTFRAYEICWKTATAESKKEVKKATKTGICKPCKRPKNNHISFVQTHALTYFRKQKNDAIIPRMRVDITCTENAYLILEERPQFTSSQFISQIGGDLGLYIGFSMTSVLQLFAFVYYVYHQRRRISNAEAMTWYHAIKNYIMKSVNDFEEQDSTRISIQKLALHDQEIYDRLSALEHCIEELQGGRASGFATQMSTPSFGIRRF